MRKQQACNWVLGCAILCLVLWEGADAQNGLSSFWNIPNYCKVGGDEGWNIQQGNSTFLQNWADVSNASACSVFVFTSAPGANHTVIVLATTDRSLTAASVCQDPSLNSAVGRNHFATNVSLIVLKSNLTYWFLSGVEGECAAGLVFRVQALAAAPGVNQSSPARDVGVAYNIEANAAAPEGSGAWAPAQPVFVTGTSQRTVFYGDALGGVFNLSSSDDQLHTLVNRGPVSCTNSTASITNWFIFSEPRVRLYSVFMHPALAFDHAIVVREVKSNTSTAEQTCNAGTRVADVVVAQTTADDCSVNPGAPYLCPK